MFLVILMMIIGKNKNNMHLLIWSISKISLNLTRKNKEDNFCKKLRLEAETKWILMMNKVQKLKILYY